jgi:N-methylhydantoinase B
MLTDTLQTGPAPAAPSEIDPITLSVLIKRFQDISNEMTLTLEYTARSSVLALARDFSCAVYDRQARQIAMMDALPGHTASMHIVLGEIARRFAGSVQEGDVYMCNSAFHGNTHIGDLVTAEPVFVDGELMFWSVTKGHQLDTGGYAPSSVLGGARDLYQEGLQIPPIRICEAGEPCDDVLDLYLANMRYREVLWGDLQAQLGSIRKGRLRLEELVFEYGRQEVERYLEAIYAHAGRYMSAAIRNIPDGTYRSEGWVDTDGQGGFDVPIKCAVTVEDDRVQVDFAGSGPQTESGLNGSYATLQASASIPFMYYMDPDAPHNHGCFGHLSIDAPKGTICNADYPASTSAGTIVPSDAMHDCVNKAMAQAIPDLVPGGGARCGNNPAFAGVDEETGEKWGAMLFNNGGGSGASKDADGWPLIVTINGLGGLKSQSIEQVEQLYPLEVIEMEIEPDSMGFGRWIGGPGVRLAVRPTKGAMEVITFGDGERNPPHGVLGGHPGIGGGHYVELSGGARRFFPASAHYRCPADAIRVGVSTGGGGYGLPHERDVERVREDVRDGILSRHAAATVFGVIVNSAWDPVVDLDATEARRRVLAEQERPLIDPTEPAASDWLEESMRPEDQYEANPQGR